jgi:serine/threonine protein kinase
VTHKGSAKVLEIGMSRWTSGGRIRAEAATSPRSLGPETVPVVSYMSPNKCWAVLLMRSDVFSLGVALRMLTGRNPFTAATAADTVVNVIAAKIGPAHALSTSLGDLDALVMRAMAKEIDQRPQSAASLSAELRGIGAILDVRSGDAGPSELLPLDDEGTSRARWWIVAAAILGIGVLAWWILK